MIAEKRALSFNGYISLIVLLVLSAVTALMVLKTGAAQSGGQAGYISLLIIEFIGFGGFFILQPNQAKVLTLFGHYVGTEKRSGLRWTIPLFAKKQISLRIRNFESSKIKVNDNQGNPIEIATVVVWSVTDTAEAMFEVENYESFVTIQSESALRNLANSFPYDPRDDEEAEMALRSHPVDIANRLAAEIQERLGRAGITVHEARISHLAYASEIASAMLQRQQAAAIIAARGRIVEGAVSMVDMALEQLKAKHIVELDEERKAAMVSNLLVVLCADKSTQPIVNTGSLY